MGTRRPAPAEKAAVSELVRELATLLGQLGLTEIEVNAEGLSVRVQRALPAAAAPAPTVSAPIAPAAPTSAMPVGDVAPGAGITIEAPMVGTFYRGAAPAAEPYVREGDVVKEGQILCIIEAMKLMNEIESKVSGRVTRIFVENGQPVEYGQALLLINPAG